jgi:transcriptional regulator with XRE-family HTH domain
MMGTKLLFCNIRSYFRRPLPASPRPALYIDRGAFILYFINKYKYTLSNIFYERTIFVVNSYPMQLVLKTNLRNLRVHSRMTQRMLAARLQVSPSAYGNYETGYARPSYEMLYEISRLFGVTVDDLLFRDLGASGLFTRPAGAGGKAEPDHVLETKWTASLQLPDAPSSSDMAVALGRLSSLIEQLNGKLDHR